LGRKRGGFIKGEGKPSGTLLGIIFGDVNWRGEGNPKDRATDGSYGMRLKKHKERLESTKTE